ncbi:MAG: bifunctional hydroxymethylpyrimidine kinase/phosphomethylpyrimidine kinase [Candidatus Omnitrophica bacterium]|nr:bifunctional hydroxymethylpyrimidine kinase/phosphomethylpyrimidine kinase [Candidatus Omnitrophota bacterium]MBU1923127.1 bifunctional hydroxymethylpyrimidine kinase/phosphomethylpyrimidine kinase [Candidatus Omnitrophota bacterium]
MSIIVLGTVALDSVKTPFGARKELLGGSAAHFSMSARLFTKVDLVAIVGKDFPQEHISFLRHKGLDLSALIIDQGKTFRWEGEYSGDLNTALTLNTELGVLSVFKPCISEEQCRIKNIFLANVDPDIQKHLLLKMRKPALVGLDSMNYWINNKRQELIRLLKHIDIYVANDQEARALSGENNIIKAAKALRGYGAKMVLIKKGENGVLFYSDKFIFSLPAYPVEKVIDPTGAGDTFAGGFMGYLAKVNKISCLTLKKALAYGTVAASFNIEDFGLNMTSRLKPQDLGKRLIKFKDCFSF